MTKLALTAGAGRYRRPAIVVLALLLIYTLVGFLLVPRIARRQLVRIVDETLGLQARVERLRTNPYTLTLEAEGFALREPGGAELLAFNRMFVNFQISSLFRWAWTFKEIRLVEPRVDVVLLENGGINLEALRPARSKPDESADAAGPATLPRLIIHTFELDSGRARFEDRTRPTPFRTTAGPVSFTLTDFSTLPDDDGALAFEAGLESGAHFTWSGSIGVNPLRSQGHFTLSDGHMPITKRYLQQLLSFRVVDGRSGGEFDYVFSVQGEEMRIRLSRGSVTVRDLVVTPENDEVELLRLPELQLSGIAFAWPERNLTIDDATSTGMRVTVWRNPDGTLNLLEHLAIEPEEGAGGSTPEATSPAEAAAAPAATAPPENAASPLDDWRISLGRLSVDDLAIGVEDRTVDPPFTTGIDGVRIELLDIDNQPGSSFEFTLQAQVETGGSATAGGRIGALPQPALDAEVKLDGLSLLPLQAYLEELARVRIDSGAVSLDGRLTSSPDEQLAYRGSAELADLACHDVRKDERLLALGRMGVDDLLLELTGARLRIAGLDLERLYGRLTIYEDGSTNIGEALAKQPAGDSAAATTEETDASAAGLPLSIEIGEVRIRDGSADFADLSLPLPFVSHIDALEGNISEMSTGGTTAQVELGGTVDEHGLARIEGSLDFFAPDMRSDMAVAFRNVEMSRLTPYTTKFAGYEIEDGRLSLDLRYRLENRRLESENEILIERLTLGDKVESPDAPSLPVKLAVAMLKDKQGNIELDIPVGGTLDDPEFAYGTFVWKAIKNVMGKVVTAPFRALARLIGSDKDLEIIEFEPAGSDIAPPARDKLEQLAQALAERPELVLEVQGVFDPEIDAAAIREERVEALVDERLTSTPQPEGAEPALASERRRAALESLFVERFPQQELDQIVATNMKSAGPAVDSPAADEPGVPVLDLAAYLDDMRERIVTAQSVPEGELVSLADARAVVIGEFLTRVGQVSGERIHTVEGGPIDDKHAGNNWIRLHLVLSTK